MLWCFSILNQRIQLAILSLDVKLGGAIQQEIARIQDDLVAKMGNQSPLPGILAKVFENAAPHQSPALEILKDESGKFSSE